jgi:hypothetical protein
LLLDTYGVKWSGVAVATWSKKKKIENNRGMENKDSSEIKKGEKEKWRESVCVCV